MKRDFVASSFHSLQPRLAQGINRAIDLRLIFEWECPGPGGSTDPTNQHIIRYVGSKLWGIKKQVQESLVSADWELGQNL